MRWAVGVLVLAGWATVARGDGQVQVFVCATSCVALHELDEDGVVDLVLLGDLDHPVARSGGRTLTMKVCDEPPGAWCADGVSLAGLEVTTAGGIEIELVGPAVVMTPSPGADPDADPFEDAVLVGGPKGYRCSGVIIDDHHVLTAGHCAPATHIGLGTTAAVARRVDVATSVVHPSADVAVLELATPVAVAMHARRGASDASPPVGRLRVLGFGVRDPLRFTGFGTRRQVDLLVDGWGCQPLRAGKLGCRPGLEMHLRDVAGNDTCFGDSGGPVFESTAEGWRLIAITSRGAHPRRVLCGEGGIYERIDRIAPWLRKVIP